MSQSLRNMVLHGIIAYCMQKQPTQQQQTKTNLVGPSAASLKNNKLRGHWCPPATMFSITTTLPPQLPSPPTLTLLRQKVTSSTLPQPAPTPSTRRNPLHTFKWHSRCNQHP
mmetsp:Transcript_43282/g.50686  ORF Transcript_43282/g.50686 Transcript_43282/m.50686 type:complete len:112 (-) Transcript_43282:993-1328(-)